MYKRKDKNLWVEKFNGKTFYGHTQKEVVEKIRAYKEDRGTNKKIADVIDEWVESIIDSLSPSRQRMYTAAAKRFREHFGNRRLSGIRTQDLAVALSSVTEGLTAYTARSYRSALTRSLQYARECGYTDENPADGLTIPRGLRPTRRRELPSDADVASVIANPSYPFGLFANIALFTGLRRGEILALRINDIDLGSRIIHVTKSVQFKAEKTPVIKEPKTKSSVRIVSIPDQLYPLLRNLPYDIVISNHGEYFEGHAFAYGWKKYAKSIGITATPHQFRHLYTSAILDMGLAPHEAQLLLGHASMQTTQRVYDHIRDQRRIAAAAKTRGLSF